MIYKCFLLTAVTALVLSAAPIQTAAYSFWTAPTSVDQPLVLGFQFSTNEPLTISALGFYDDGGDGLAASHDIGVFDSVGNLVVSTTLQAGAGGTLFGNFRYVSIVPSMLDGNQQFTIAATSGGLADPWAYGFLDSTLSGFSNDPAITIGEDGAVYIYSSALQYPTAHYNYSLYAGPNFMIDHDQQVVTPEPAAAVLLAPALGILLLLRRRVHCG